MSKSQIETDLRGPQAFELARRALEHLFERDGATPREIHVLVATLDGADLALAEAIGQSIDPR